MIVRVFILVQLLLTFHFSQAQLLKSKVIDQYSKAPLEGATITVGNFKTISNKEGEFSFNCNLGKELLITYIGYTSKNISIKSCALPPTIELEQDQAQLEAIKLGSSAASNKDLLSIPSSISRIGLTELKRGNGLFLDDAIQSNITGVSMNRRSVGGGQQLNIRGYGNGTRGTRGMSSNFDGQGYKVYINGIVLTDAEGITTFDDIDFASIANVEISKGPSGSLYGLAIAGAMNLTSLKPEKNKTSISHQMMIGNYGLRRNTTSFQTATNKSSLLLNYGDQRSDGFTLHNSSNKRFVNVISEFDPSEKQHITAYFGYSDSYDQRAGELTIAQFENNDYSGNPEYIKRNGHSNVITFRAGISHTYQLNKNVSNVTSIFGTAFNSNASSAAGWTDKGTMNYGARSVVNAKFELSNGISVTSVTGIEAQKQNANTMGYSMKQDPTDNLTTWTLGVNPYWVINAATSNVYTEAYTKSIFSEWALNLPSDLSLTAGLGSSTLNLFLHDRFNPALATRPAIFEKNYNQMYSPHLALNKQFAKKQSVFISYSKGYKPPVSSYFYIAVPAVATNPVTPASGRLNDNLQPESGSQFEVGTKGKVLGSRLSYELVYFNAVFKNKMTAVAVSSPLSPSTTLYSYVVNGGTQIHKGFELSTKYTIVQNESGLLNGLAVFGNLTYSNFKYGDNFRFQKSVTITEDYSNKTVAAVPKCVLNIGIDFLFKFGFYGNLVYNYRDKMPITSLNDYFTKSYSLLNGKIGTKRQLSKRISMDTFFGVNNITGTKYFTMVFANQLPDAYVPAPRKANYYGSIQLNYNF